MNDMSSEPRIAWNNDPSYARAPSVEDPWFDHYVTVSNAADVLNSISNRGEEAFTNAGVDPNRLRALVNFTMGLSYGYIGATFDRGFLVDETTDLEAVARGDVELELVPYTQVLDFGIAKLDKAIEVASNNSFQIPADRDWIFGLTLTNDDLVQLANSFKARFETWKARTPSEREGLRWGQVLTWIDQGSLEWDCTKWVGPQEGTWSRADYRTIGPADESGGYENWLSTTPASQRNPFVMETSDRRIQGDPDDPESDGSQYSFQGVAFTAFPVERGSYHYSDRTFERYEYYGNTINGPMPILTKPEMDLLKAEALLHTGGDPGQVADLINNTRVENGQLAPATAGTPVGSIDDAPNPLAPGDVTLWSMLKYEFNMEVQMTGSGAVFFADRGWGDLGIQGDANALPGQHADDRPPRHRDIGHRAPGKPAQPVLGVKGQHETRVADVEQFRLGLIALGLAREQQEKLRLRETVIKAQPRRIRLRISLHRRMGLIQRGFQSHAITSLTRARSAGSTSASNHEFFFNQAVLRQLGCGKGRTSGQWSRQRRTVSVTPDFVPR
jgi:hypothetical protein